VTAARIVVVAAILAAGAAQAQSPETLAWLRKMHEASQIWLLPKVSMTKSTARGANTSSS
jgi:negative regulator of sigma E activity